ncbi:hypothetical protein [Nocardioides sp. TF02-7]|uniref:hypothetical protein n=1 Tax=Nocardioides sp. TF02-7 TaxID=2917724 RepID=UPI0031F55E5F
MIDLRRTSVPRMADPATSWARIRPEAAGGGLRSAEAVATALLDAPTPGLFGEPEPPAFVPTIDYAVHLAPDAGEWDPAGWLRLDHATAWATRQHCVDEVHAWTADGRLLATLRQTRAVWWPPAGTEESA